MKFNITKKSFLFFKLRFADIILSLFGLLFLSPVFLFVYILIFIENKNPIFRQKRLGKDKKIFIIYKFRSMKLNTANCATHLVNPKEISFLGRFLRKTKLDELPQLWNVFKGDMSLVGPRPCLDNQKELILIRDQYEIFKMKPGITGLAQIKKIDMSNPEKLAKTEMQMKNCLNFNYYFYYIFLTFLGFGFGDRIKKNNF